MINRQYDRKALQKIGPEQVLTNHRAIHGALVERDFETFKAVVNQSFRSREYF